MTRALQTSAIIMLAVVPAAGCGDPAEPAAPAALEQELRDQLGRFTRAVHQRDAATLKSVLSSEVLGRLDTYQGGIDKFIEKDRAVMLDVFKTMDANVMNDRFTVSELQVEGDTASVLPAYDGQSTGKRFYFVKENGVYKVNVAPPGFSRRLPDGSRPTRSTFKIRSVVDPPPGGKVGCQQDFVNFEYVTVRRGDVKISCMDLCGVFDGSQFHSIGGITFGRSTYCDWHWQGEDVVVDRGSNGFFAICRDPC